MADLWLRSYILHRQKVERVGLNLRRKFPDLAGSKTVWMSVYFHGEDSGNLTIDNITLDWAYFDLTGAWDLEYHKRAAVAAVGDMLPGPLDRVPSRSSRVIPFKPRIARVALTDTEKLLIKERVDKDFGQGTWEGLPEAFRMNLWLNGSGVPRSSSNK